MMNGIVLSVIMMNVNLLCVIMTNVILLRVIVMNDIFLIVIMMNGIFLSVIMMYGIVLCVIMMNVRAVLLFRLTNFSIATFLLFYKTSYPNKEAKCTEMSRYWAFCAYNANSNSTYITP